MHGHVLRSSYNLSVLYSTRTVIHFYTWCLNVHLFEFLPVTSFGRVGRNVGLFSAWRVKTLFNHFIRGCPSGLPVVEHSVNIWWPKFDAGRLQIMRYSSLLRYKKMSFQSRSETVGNEFSEPIWNCRYTEQGSGESLEASSIPLDPQQRKPDDQTCCDCVVEASTGDGWPDLRRWQLEM